MLPKKRQSRLDGLLALLEAKDTSASIRRLAAQQLAELVHVQQSGSLFVLDAAAVNVLHHLQRVVLQSKHWDARVSAAQALKHFIQRVQPYLQVVEPERHDGNSSNAWIALSQLEPLVILETGSVLASSSGAEYQNAATDPRQQWLELRRELLGGVAASAIDFDIGVSIEDIHMTEVKKETLSEPEPESLRVALRRNPMQTKTRQQKRQRVLPASSPAFSSPLVARTLERDSLDNGDNQMDSAEESTNAEQGITADGSPEDADRPECALASALRRLVNAIADAILSPDWEQRHGAAVAFREILSVKAFRAWLPDTEREDIASRLYVLLAMDRFGDYAFEQVIAPVRETAAMALGSAAVGLESAPARCLGSHLLQLIRYRSDWQVRHGGLLGLRYVLAVRSELRREQLDEILAVLITVLQEDDDDVRAAACEVIIPIADDIERLDGERKTNYHRKLLLACWSSLLELDELSACTTAMVRCIEALVVVNPSSSTILGSDLARLVRLLRHRSVETRRAALSCVQQMLQHWPASSPEYERLLGSGLLTALLAALCLETGSDEVSLDLLQQCWKLICSTRCQQSICLENKIPEPELDASFGGDAMSPVRQPSTDGEKNWPGSAKRPLKTQICSKHPISTCLIDAVSKARSPAQAQQALEQLFQKMRWKLPETATALPRSDHSSGYQMHLHAVEALVMYDRMHRDASVESANVFTSWFAGWTSSRWLAQHQFLCLFGRATDALDTELEAAISVQLTLLEPTQDAIHDEARAELNALFWQMLKTLQELKPEQIPSLDSVHDLRAATLEHLFQCCADDALWLDIREPEAAARVSAMRLNLRAAITECMKVENSLRLFVAAAAVGALVRHLKEMPARITPWIRILFSMLLQQLPNGMGVYVPSDNGTWSVPESAQAVAAHDLARLTTRLAPTSKAREQIVKNLVTAACSQALAELARVYAAELFHELPQLEREVFFDSDTQAMSTASVELAEQRAKQEQRRDIVLCAIADALDPALVPRVISLFPALIQSRARAIVPLCRLFTQPAMEAVVQHLLPLLEPGEEAPSTASRRLAGAENDADAQRYQALVLLADIIQGLGERIIPYAPFLVVPLLARLVDHNERIRSVAATEFGALVRVLPLEGFSSEQDLHAPHLRQQLEVARAFIAQLLGQKPMERFVMTIPIGDGVQLRGYQQEGLDWLVFLHRYGLHGALCDDMGLGKTLMTLCMLAADRHHLPSATSITPRTRPVLPNEDEGLQPAGPRNPLPSLVICPASVMHHWHDEVMRFFPDHLTPVLVYAGSPSQRQELAKRYQDPEVAKPAILITSYEIARSDIDFLSTLCFSYVVLDEGHMIKNARSKISQAVRQIQARHRLLLTGTPIQNSVTELWSLFDFLMPGYLGTEQAFAAQYAKPIQAARNPKCTDTVREAGERALAILHRQVLPFILRRMKEDVMKELPPKVIQDRTCELSDVQRYLYDSFIQSARLEWLTTTGSANQADSSQHRTAQSNVFYALMFLRRLCTHPRLVLPELSMESRRDVERLLRQARLDWHDLQIAPKMAALRDLLLECGIAQDGCSLDEAVASMDAGSDTVLASLTNGTKHRALIFAQLKETLDTIEQDVFQRYLPQVTYLRLDGSVEPRLRQDIVHRFNRDPTIHCLLLTTHVGGLGLNLTGADTVIFVECDYNPTVDLQAMDRAHRIGQTRVVTVYRMITRGTIEEKIMSIQRFKMHLANTVVNQENASLQFMNTEHIMDLFRPVASTETDSDTNAAPHSATSTGAKLVQSPAPQASSTLRLLGPSSLSKVFENDLETYGEEFQHTKEFVQGLLAQESDVGTKSPAT